MIKLVICITRRPELSYEEFIEYWLSRHGELIKKYAKKYKIKKYVQSHTIHKSLNDNIRTDKGMFIVYDGIAELWWNSKNDFINMVNSTTGKKISSIFYEDEKKFIDFSKSTAFLTEEYILVKENDD